jgi:hypothetical protein
MWQGVMRRYGMFGNITLSGVADVFTIIGGFFTVVGVFLAICIYRRWTRDYKLQKAHEYALPLLKKIKYLHAEIEVIRRPKFHNPKTISEDIEKTYIPEFEEKILKKIVEIQAELLIAKDILMKHKDIQLKFNKKVVGDILIHIISAIDDFRNAKNNAEKNGKNFKVENTDLLKIFFPDQNKNRILGDIIKSKLGSGVQVINDDFNQRIEANFTAIYDDLENNLTMGKKRGNIMRFLTFFRNFLILLYEKI